MTLADEIPEAQPGVTAHERLWAQMDTLKQDVERAQDAQRTRMVSSDQHADALASLYKLQTDFHQKMVQQDANLGIDHYKELWTVGDPEVLRARLFSDPHFEALNLNVSKSSAAITALANAMHGVPREKFKRE